MGQRRKNSSDWISSCAILMAGVVGGVLVFTVALPLALSSPFPTPKQGEWIIQSAIDTTAAGAPTLVPPPMEPLPSAQEAEAAEALADATVADDVEAEPAPDYRRSRMAFATRWDLTVPPRNDIPRIEVPAEATKLPPADSVAVAPHAKNRDTAAVDPVQLYLWEVYRRKPIKSDSSGDFTWKDPAAAKRRGVSLEAYVIGGMDPDFREQLYHAGHAMDASGLRWSMLSAFRDDYRQALASGFKARGGNSQHGGSNATGGYGYGRAIDITVAEGDASAVWHWIDSHGAKFGLRRPMPGIDPAHIQPGNKNSFHDLGRQLREARLKLDNELNGVVAEAAVAKMKFASREEPSEGRRRRHFR